MGSRGNIFVAQEIVDGKYEGVYLYRHCEGYQLARDLRIALMIADKGKRWNDSQYLPPIIFRVMSLQHGILATSGLGISSSIGDNQYPIIRVIPHYDNPMIQICEEGQERDPYVDLRGCTFRELVDMTDLEAVTFHMGTPNYGVDPLKLPPELEAFLASYHG